MLKYQRYTLQSVFSLFIPTVAELLCRYFVTVVYRNIGVVTKPIGGVMRKGKHTAIGAVASYFRYRVYLVLLLFFHRLTQK